MIDGEPELTATRLGTANGTAETDAEIEAIADRALEAAFKEIRDELGIDERTEELPAIDVGIATEVSVELLIDADSTPEELEAAGVIEP